MRLFALVFALLVCAPLLTLAATDVSLNQYPLESECAGEPTLAGTQSADNCQVAGENSYMITCTGERHGTYTIAEYADNSCGGTTPTATYPGEDSTSCVSATLIGAQFTVDCLVPCTDEASCNNHGTCNVETGVCTCTDDYTGDTCLVAPGGTPACPTDSAQCGEHGACNAEQTACECTDSYTGALCDVPPTTTGCPTDSTQCGEHGACNEEQTECVCTDGYSGPLCATAPECATSCGEHGTCNEDFTGCTCTGGYTGSTELLCDVPPECETTCGDNGFCNTAGDGCECTNGYTGDLCTVAPIVGACPADSTQCGEHGSCNDETTACECTDGWRGNTCAVPPVTATCSDTTCQNGSCDGALCVCEDGWSGTNCDNQVADMAVITYYSGNTCEDSTQTATLEVSLDTCTAFPDNLRSGTVLCPNGVDGAYTLKVYESSTTCTGDLETQLGSDHTDCRALAGGAGYLTVRCSQSGAIAIQASFMLVALLAFFTKFMQ